MGLILYGKITELDFRHNKSQKSFLQICVRLNDKKDNLFTCMTQAILHGIKKESENSYATVLTNGVVCILRILIIAMHQHRRGQRDYKTTVAI